MNVVDPNLTDADLEAQLTDDMVKDATWMPKSADATAEQKQPDPKKDPEPKDADPKGEEKKGDDGESKDTDPDNKPEKGTMSDWIKKLLEKKNNEKKLKEEALKVVADKEKIIADQQKIIDELKNPKDDDNMSDEERQAKLQEAITKKTIAEDKKDEALEKSKSIDSVDETKRSEEIWEFLNKNPELLANKEEIMDLAKSYPTLPMEQVHKLRVAETDPLKLLSEQDINKIKWWYNLAWKFDKSKVNWKDPNDMNDDELEKSLQDSFAGWSNPIWG